MNLLSTVCLEADNEPGKFNVFWRNGLHGAGLITVNVDLKLGDPDVIAELSAMQWLLSHRAIFGETQNGKGLSLKISAGAIRKAVRATTSSDTEKFGKPHLKPYAQFLATRFCSAELIVSKDRSWVPDRISCDQESLSIRHPLPNVIAIPGIGAVAVSTHAFERFGERLCMADRSDTWRLLSRVVRGPLQRKPRTPGSNVMHGRGGELWVNPELGWGFVLVSESPLPVMVTAYAPGGLRKAA